MEILKSIKKADKDTGEVFIYTEEQLMARLKFFIGICLALTLTGIVFVVLYSIIFVTQPLNAISPIDQKFFELIIPIATFLTGTLSGIMLAGNDKDARMEALKAANKAPTVSPSPTTPSPSAGGFSASANIGGASFGFKSAAPAPGAFGATPSFGAAPAVAAAPTFVSATGKVGPIPPEDPEL